MAKFPPNEADFWELATAERLSERLARGEDIGTELRQICNDNALGFKPAPL